MRHPTALPRILHLTAADLPAVLALYAAESPALPDGFLQQRREAELLGYLGGSEGQAYGVFHGRALQAVGLLRLPGPDAFAGRPAFPYVPAADWPQRSAFGECVLVRAEAAGRRWLCAGVHLENRASWRNLLRSGFLLIGCREEPSPPRLGFLRPLNGSSLPLRPSTLRRVPLPDLTGHQAALAEGLIGAALDGEEMLYRAPVRALALAEGAARAA